MANNYGKAEDYVKLTDYIQKIYQESHLEPPWVLLMSQVKYLCKQHNLKYIDLLNVIQYMTQIEGISITDRDTLGLVPYYVEKTDKYMQKYKEVRKEIKNFDYTAESTIKIKPTQMISNRKKKNENFD